MHMMNFPPSFSIFRIVCVFLFRFRRVFFSILSIERAQTNATNETSTIKSFRVLRIFWAIDALRSLFLSSIISISRFQFLICFVFMSEYEHVRICSLLHMRGGAWQ